MTAAAMLISTVCLIAGLWIDDIGVALRYLLIGIGMMLAAIVNELREQFRK